MVQNTSGHHFRSDEEWMDIFQECRTSGLTDKEWCEQHQIGRSTFYYHQRRLRKKACRIPAPLVPGVREKQEVVDVSSAFTSPVLQNPQETSPSREMDTAVRLIFRGFQMEITNHAAGDTIRKTISALQDLG
ncbi:MAG: IS66 family insertion sequence element accessory protein TnpB [Blautia sp.]|nr:IS66 family insertion sequence element accessory protein TnpB [Blautia sp.]